MVVQEETLCLPVTGAPNVDNAFTAAADNNSNNDTISSNTDATNSVHSNIAAEKAHIIGVRNTAAKRSTVSSLNNSFCFRVILFLL